MYIKTFLLLLLLLLAVAGIVAETKLVADQVGLLSCYCISAKLAHDFVVCTENVSYVKINEKTMKTIKRLLGLKKTTLVLLLSLRSIDTMCTL